MLVVKSSDVQFDTGFFIITLHDGKQLAACLELGDFDDQLGCKEALNKLDVDDCGIDEGMCLETNEWLLGDEKENYAEVLDIIKSEALVAGVELV